MLKYPKFLFDQKLKVIYFYFFRSLMTFGLQLNYYTEPLLEKCHVKIQEMVKCQRLQQTFS